MSVLESIQTALIESGKFAGISFYEGAYPGDAAEPCGKIVFIGGEKPIRFMGQATPLEVETFKVFVRDNSYRAMETTANDIKGVLTNAGFIQIGGCEDIEPKQSENFMQIAVSFKIVGRN